MTREDAVKRLRDVRKYFSGGKLNTVDNDDICDALTFAIEALQEQKTGKWIHDGKDFPQGNDWIHCSVCGKRGINVPADLTNYCPNCGAKMEVSNGIISSGDLDPDDGIEIVDGAGDASD